MHFALVQGQRSRPSPNLLGFCPACGAPTRSKCGKILVWHWAHIATKHCDSWWENETEWHRQWKGKFPENHQEVIHIDETTGERHIADVKTANGLVIELQNSSISTEELQSREIFYKNMIWVVNGQPFRSRFTIYPNKLPAPHSDLQRDLRFNASGSEFRLISTVWFGSGYSDKYQKEKYEWLLNNNYVGHHFFEWNRPRPTWFVASNPVYFDFGEDVLFELQKYPDHNRYCVQIITKSLFMSKHLSASCNEGTQEKYPSN